MKIFSAKWAGAAMALAILGLGLCFAPYLSADDFCYGQTRQTKTGEIENPCYQPRCHRGYNARGKVIKWVKTEQQCRNQSTGRSWGHSARFVNIYRDGGREIFDR